MISLGDGGRMNRLLLLAFFFLQACNSSTSNPLIGDFEASSVCPPTGCADTIPKTENVFLELDNKADIYLENNDSIVELAGTCSTSTYPSNRIEVTVSGAPVASLKGFNLGASSMVPRCSMGKFYVYLDACSTLIRCGAASKTVRITLVPLDQTQKPAAAETIQLNVVRRAAPVAAVCPAAPACL